MNIKKGVQISDSRLFLGETKSALYLLLQGSYYIHSESRNDNNIITRINSGYFKGFRCKKVNSNLYIIGIYPKPIKFPISFKVREGLLTIDCDYSIRIL